VNRQAALFLRAFVPFAAIVLLIVYFYVDSTHKATQSRLESAETLSVQLGAGVVDRRLQILHGDLQTLAGSSALRQFAATPTVIARQRIEEDFSNLSQARKIYDQIRWIAPDGREMVRVNLDDGNSRIVPPEQLQDKSQRPYFQATMALAPGNIYVSALDLNVEADHIEVPFKPILRLATPLADVNGKKVGMLILNYRGVDMLNFVRDVTRPVADHLMMVNQDGHFLLSPNRDDEWGFMLGQSERSLARRYPGSWQRLQETKQGQFEDANGLWTVATIHPSLYGGPDQQDDGKEWKIVAHLTPSRLSALHRGLSPEQLGLVVLFLIGGALVILSLIRARHREATSETRFRVYFERAMVGMAVTSTDKRWQLVNPALCNILGYPAEELVGKTWSELTHPDDLAANNLKYEQVMRGECNGYELDKRFIRRDGQVIDTFIAAQAVRKANGKVDYFLVIVEDITARLSAERALRASEERLRLLGDNLPDSYVYQCTKQADGSIRFTYVSSGIRRIHGIEPDDVLRDPDLINRHTDPAQLQTLRAAEMESMRSLQDFSMELHVRLADGRWGWLLVRSRPRRLFSGDIVWDGVASDITAHREAAALLARQAKRSAAMLELPRQSEHLDEAAFLTYALGQIQQMTDSRQAFLYFVGQPAGRLDLAAWTAISPTAEPSLRHLQLEQAGRWADALRQRTVILLNGRPGPEELRGLPDNVAASHRLLCVPVIDDGDVQLLVGVADKQEDYAESDIETVELLANETWRIVHQRRAEAALRIASQVVNASPVVCFRWQAGERRTAVYASDNVMRWGYGTEALLAGHPCFDELLHPDDLALVKAGIAEADKRGESGYILEYRVVTADRQIIWVVDRSNILRDVTGSSKYYDSVLTDITERKQQARELTENLAAQRQLNKRLEEAHNQLLQSEKMASIGQLAAGVAHELNNPIGFVHSNLGTLESYLRDVMEIIDTQDQALATVADLDETRAALARLKEERDFAFVRQDIGQLLGESKDGLSRVRKIVQDLKNFSHVSEQEWQWADLHEGLDSTLNIVWNELKYKCKVIKEYGELPKVHCLISQLNQVFMNLLVNAGHAIEQQGVITLRTFRLDDFHIGIEIADTGKGIAPEHLNRIFEPFFTTKPVGKGTGLGLSLAYGIIDKHGGRIEVDSTPGVGTRFRLVLPIDPRPQDIPSQEAHS
jgi:PAS domain S-box-containing protein